MLAEHDELLRWLAEEAGGLPTRFTTLDRSEVEAVGRLLAALPPGFPRTRHHASPTREAAILCVLYAVGLRRAEQLATAIVIGRLASTMAEALAERPANFGRYPANLAKYHYRESR